MFVQVIEGSTRDTEGLRNQLDRWAREVAPGAAGYLGSTGGITEEGTVVVLARFESEAAARASSARPEQDAWWNETAKHFEGEVTFRDLSDVETALGGGSDEAGFVQVMRGRAHDRARLTALEAKWMPAMAAARPDLIGVVRGWEGDVFTQAAYFTSEAAARAGEAAEPPSGASAEDLAELREFGSLMGEMTYTDLRDPWLHTP